MKKTLIALIFCLPFLAKAQVPVLNLDTTYKAKANETGVLKVLDAAYLPKLANSDTTIFAQFNEFGKLMQRKLSFSGSSSGDTSSLSNRINAKQNLITLTTTGTSGAATFNQSSGALNIPNYATGGSGGSAKAYAPLLVRNDSVYQRFNVLAYGADNTGNNDATVAIQTAINAANVAGGGEVYFPNGTYIINGALQTNIGGLNMNSQLYIPARNFDDTLRTHIILRGETPPNFTQMSPLATFKQSSKGVVLKSTLTTGSAGAAVIGTRGNSSGFGFFNYTYLSVENIMITVKNNPTGNGPVVGGINYRYGASLQTDKVVVTIDTLANGSTLPSNDVTGIETPDNSSETMSNIQNTVVGGLKNGYKIGEHVVINQAQAFVCFNGVNIKEGNHSLASLRFGSYWCVNDMYVSGFTTLANFQLSTEWRQAGKWFDNVSTIKDTANLAKGQVFYTIVAAAIGKDNSKFSKIGGTNLRHSSNDDGVLPGTMTTFMAIGGTVTGGTSGSIPYIGTNGVLRQDNTALSYDSANIALKLKNSVATGIASVNLTNSANGVGQIFKTGASYTPFRNIAANDIGIYNGSTGNISILNDNLTGNINFAVGNTSTPHVTFSSAGAVRFHTYGAGILGTDASGNITARAAQWITTGSDLYYNAGRVAIGKTTAAVPLDIEGNVNNLISVKNTTASGFAGVNFSNSSNVAGQIFKAGTSYTAFKNLSASDFGIYNASSGNMSFLNDNTSGNINFAAGGSTTADLTISSAGLIRFHAYGAGTLTTDANGNITATSDTRLKKNIKTATTGLKELMKLKPITYSWNEKSGNETKGTYLGFSAQNVKASIPHGTGEMSDGYLTLQDRAIMATLVNAVKEQQAQIEALKLEIKNLKK